MVSCTAPVVADGHVLVVYNLVCLVQRLSFRLLTCSSPPQALDPPLHAHLSSLDALSYFFCFRWILVLFKREFRLEEVLRLWEAVWACPFTGQLPVHLAAAVLVHHRRDILVSQAGRGSGPGCGWKKNMGNLLRARCVCTD